MITFTVNGTPESELIIATKLGYSNTIPNIVDGVDIGQPNPQTPQEFIREVFAAKFGKEASDLLIAHNDEQKQPIYDAEDKTIRDAVQATISYRVI